MIGKWSYLKAQIVRERRARLTNRSKGRNRKENRKKTKEENSKHEKRLEDYEDSQVREKRGRKRKTKANKTFSWIAFRARHALRNEMRFRSIRNLVWKIRWSLKR